jgi:hypothetical protein
VDVDGVEGDLPTTASCIIIMRATQKKMMSKPVTRTSVGKYFFSASVSSGQPRVPMGQRPEENQVSRTSGSRERIGNVLKFRSPYARQTFRARGVCELPSARELLVVFECFEEPERHWRP